MSVGYLLRALGHPESFGTAEAVARLAGLAVLACLAAVQLRRAWRHRDSGPTIMICCGVTFALVTVLSPVFYPWYAITPLAVLAASVADKRARRWIAVMTVALTFLVLPNGLGLP